MRKGEKLYLLMSRTPSNLWNEATLSESYSTNKENWLSIPTHIKVSGSKYALVISELKPCDFMLNLNDYKLPV